MCTFIFTHLSEPGLISAGFQWTGSTPAGFQEAFRAAGINLFPHSGVLWEQGIVTGNTYGPGRPTRPPEAKFLWCQPQKINLRCRSASENVFGTLVQNFRGFNDLKRCFQTQKR